MIPRYLLLALISVIPAGAQAQSLEPGIEASAGFKIEKLLAYRDTHAFTWDDRAQLWLLASSGQTLTANRVQDVKSAQIGQVRTFQRIGHGKTSLLVSGNTFFVSDGPVIRGFPTSDAKSDGILYLPPAGLFPPHLEISSLVWAPLGDIYFLYRSTVSRESGIGRLNLQGPRWDVLAKGTFTSLALDADAFPIAADGAFIFRIASGLDYDQGLVTYQRSDLALGVDKPDLRPSFVTLYLGSAWPSAHRGSWLLFDSASSTLEQFKDDGALKHWRTVARLDNRWTFRDLQVGPDGTSWMLVAPADNTGTQTSALLRLTTAEPGNQPLPVEDLTPLPNERLVGQFGHPNSWQRDAALRILDQRDDLRTARGLHPGTPLHDAFRVKTNSAIARAFATLSLHRLGLLDETLLENAAEDDEPLVRTWAGLLFGERNYPTGTAFDQLIKLAKSTNLVVRSAAAVAARQFVSGSLAVDTPPRALPIREVFTGGILSTLWFSTEKSRSPEFDLLFWNAVRPITAFDPAHPVGFFNGDREKSLAIAYWIVGLITRQIAETEDRFKQQDAMIMVSELDPANPRMILHALQGLKTGSPNRKVIPTDRALKVLKDFSTFTNTEIASLSQDIHRQWLAPFK